MCKLNVSWLPVWCSHSEVVSMLGRKLIDPGLSTVNTHCQLLPCLTVDDDFVDKHSNFMLYNVVKPRQISLTSLRKVVPSPDTRMVVYVRQENEEIYTPLHLVPPTVPGLARAIESKYNVSATAIR